MAGGMPDFNRDLAETQDHPNLINLLDVCNATCGEQAVQFSNFKSSPFLEFWSSSLILRWDAKRNDFRYIFWVTQLATVYGLELTDKYISDGDHKNRKKPFIKAHFESMSLEKLVYLSGTLKC